MGASDQTVQEGLAGAAMMLGLLALIAGLVVLFTSSRQMGAVVMTIGVGAVIAGGLPMLRPMRVLKTRGGASRQCESRTA
ncbi:hypothetical protein [Phytohabitans rumicis]|uniref:hypothetical protein n=1 Tax=Phytohabitans rumicis TaxID=1076125 RepID=UPI0015630468|nr:hypothetical protein [Phytohabitans rumicis]